ncbi:MAG: hypothetical protein JW839_16850 [Candidatus Lokiarchaeota archaeon]|nr:hypothetical protein [Candidatus Lokiarchaeota archaeon]
MGGSGIQGNWAEAGAASVEAKTTNARHVATSGVRRARILDLMMVCLARGA